MGSITWLAFGRFSMNNAIKMGSRFGKVVAMEDTFQEGYFFRNFLRVKVTLDVRKPLSKGLWIPRPNLPKIWVSARYEKLQHFYFNCDVLGHDVKACKKVVEIGKKRELKYGA